MLDRPVSPTPVVDEVLKLCIWQGVVVVTVGEIETTVLLISFADAGPARDTIATIPAATAKTRRPSRSEWWTVNPSPRSRAAAAPLAACTKTPGRTGRSTTGRWS